MTLFNSYIIIRKRVVDILHTREKRRQIREQVDRVAPERRLLNYLSLLERIMRDKQLRQVEVDLAFVREIIHACPSCVDYRDELGETALHKVRLAIN
jgi:hypothetical protein